jgi:hypothetical protein
MGSLTPLGSIISLLAYGKYVAKQLGSPGMVIWDADGEGIWIKDIYISMGGFRSFVKKVVSSAWELLKKDLLFGVGGITVDKMNMRDTMTEAKLGYSMVDNEYNRLSGGLKYMLHPFQVASNSYKVSLEKK